MDTLASRGINKAAANEKVAMPGNVILKSNTSAFPGNINGRSIIIFIVAFFIIRQAIR